MNHGKQTATDRIESSTNTPQRLILNTVVRSKGDKSTYVGHELEDCRDRASLHYRLPFEKARSVLVLLS
jgi:actin-related protein 6